METGNTKRIMKENEVTADDLSPCVRLFIESLLNGEPTTNAGRDAGGGEKLIDTKKDLAASTGRS